MKNIQRQRRLIFSELINLDIDNLSRYLNSWAEYEDEILKLNAEVIKSSSYIPYNFIRIRQVIKKNVSEEFLDGYKAKSETNIIFWVRISLASQNYFPNYTELQLTVTIDPKSRKIKDTIGKLIGFGQISISVAVAYEKLKGKHSAILGMFEKYFKKDIATYTIE